MKELKKILLPINIGCYTNDSVEFAISLAKIYKAEILLIQVIENVFDSKEVEELAVNSANKHLKKIQTIITNAEVKIELAAIKYGKLADIITNFALQYEVNIVILGIQRPKKQDNYLLNHSIEKIVNQSVKPVWVLREGDSKKIENILCPFDLSKEAKIALNNSIHLTQKFNAKLTILNVFSTVNNKFPWITGDYSSENDKTFRKSRDRINQFLLDFAFPKIFWKTKFRVGEPDIEILKECNEFNYDLLIMGSAGLKSLNNLRIGSVTAKVIRHAPCSFITTKSKDILNLQLETKINNINHHFSLAKQKAKSNLIDEAIEEYYYCLANNDMHVASLLGLSELYGKKGDKKKELEYKRMATEIIKLLSRNK